MFLIEKYAGKYIPGSFYSEFQHYGKKEVNPTFNILITYRIPTLKEIGSAFKISDPQTKLLEKIGDLLLEKFKRFDLERFAAGDRNYCGHDSNNFFLKESATGDVVNFLLGGDSFRYHEDPTLDFYRMALQTFLRSANIEDNGLIAAASPELQKNGFQNNSDFVVIKQNLIKLRAVLGDKDVYFFPYIFDSDDKGVAKKLFKEMPRQEVILTNANLAFDWGTRDLNDLKLGVAPLCLDLGDVDLMKKINAADIKCARWIHTTPGYGCFLEISLLMKPSRVYQSSHNEYHIGPAIQDGPGGNFGNSTRLFTTVDYNVKRFDHGLTLPRPGSEDKEPKHINPEDEDIKPEDILVDYTSFLPKKSFDERLEIWRECLSGIAAIGLAGVFGTGYTRYLDIDGDRDGRWAQEQKKEPRLPEGIAGPIKQAIGDYYQEALQMPNPYTACYFRSAQEIKNIDPEEGLPAIEL